MIEYVWLKQNSKRRQFIISHFLINSNEYNFDKSYYKENKDFYLIFISIDNIKETIAPTIAIITFPLDEFNSNALGVRTTL